MSRVEFSLNFNAPKAGWKQPGKSGYRIYVLGNFSGYGGAPRAQRDIQAIDGDSFDRVMAKVKPRLAVDEHLALRFEAIEDFHPDAWLRNIPIVNDLLSLKRELSQPSTAEQAVAKIQAFLPAGADFASPPQLSQVAETQEQMLERLLGRKPQTAIVGQNVVDRLLADIVAPHISKSTEPQYQALIHMIDTLVGEYLRGLLRRQDFRSLESLWRAMAGLLGEESSDHHQVFLVDITQAELLTELRDDDASLRQSLSEHIQLGDGEQQVLLIGDYRFGDGRDDNELLGLCSRLADACNAYFLTAAEKSLIEKVLSAGSNDPQFWKRYLAAVNVDRIMLAYPGYLLRLPYGAKRDPIDTLPFEECLDWPEAGDLLWGNAAFLGARTLMRGSLSSVSEGPGFFSDVPCFTRAKDGEQQLQPGAEMVLTESQAHTLLTHGIMPVIGYHQRQGVRLFAVATLNKNP